MPVSLKLILPFQFFKNENNQTMYKIANMYINSHISFSNSMTYDYICTLTSCTVSLVQSAIHGFSGAIMTAGTLTLHVDLLFPVHKQG